MSEQQIKIAAKLYECRTAARTILGDRFPAVMKQYGELLRSTAKLSGTDELMVAMDAANHAALDGSAQMLIWAAYVELIEPSEAR